MECSKRGGTRADAAAQTGVSPPALCNNCAATGMPATRTLQCPTQPLLMQTWPATAQSSAPRPPPTHPHPHRLLHPSPQILLAAAIIALVSTKLDDATLEGGQLKEATQASCTLGASTSSASLCTYVYTTAGVSLAVSLALALAICLTCNM